MTIGVEPWASDAALPMTGTKLPGLVQIGKELQAGFAGRSAGSGAAGEAGGVDALDRLVGRARVTGQGDGILVVRAEEIGPVLRHGLDDVGVHFEGEHAVIVAVPGAVGVLGAVRDRVPGGDLVGHAAGRRPWRSGRRTGRRRSRRAPAGPVLPLFALIASISSPEPASGLSSLTARPYFALKPSMTAAVAAPVVRQSDRREGSLLLRGGDEVIHRVGGGEVRRGKNRQSGYRNQHGPCRFHFLSPVQRKPNWKGPPSRGRWC